jgi:hypothetical protein
MPRPSFEMIYAIPVKNGEIMISRVKRGGGQPDGLSMSPRKQYINSNGQPDKFIPKDSSLQFADARQISEFVRALSRASLDIFGETPI